MLDKLRILELEIYGVGVYWFACQIPMPTFFDNNVFLWETPPRPLYLAVKVSCPQGNPSLPCCFFTRGLHLERNGPRAPGGSPSRWECIVCNHPGSHWELPSLLPFSSTGGSFFSFKFNSMTYPIILPINSILLKLVRVRFFGLKPKYQNWYRTLWMTLFPNSCSLFTARNLSSSAH